MELHALDGILAMTQSHDDAIFGACGDFELAWQAVFRNDKRMIAGAGHRARDAVEKRAAVVDDVAGLAVHQLRRADDAASEGCADGLMSETYTEDRYLDRDLSGEMLDERHADAGFLRRAR